MPPIEIQKTGEPTPKDERAASARVQRGGFAHGDILTNLLVRGGSPSRKPPQPPCPP
jgi:hypothetical protein